MLSGSDGVLSFKVATIAITKKECYLMRKILSVLMLFTAILCFGTAASAAVPTLRVAYTITTHHEPFMAAMVLCEKFEPTGVWLSKVVDKEKYDLYMDGKKVARLNVIVTKSGAEATSLFAQNHLDLTLNSFPAMLAGIDRGVKIKVLAPFQGDAIAMVSRNGIDVKGWKGFEKYVKDSKKPVVVGYHSPTSAPKIVFEAAMDNAGFRITGDGNATKADADIILMDLKSISNVVPALAAKQVEFAVVPAPTPEVVEASKQGNIVLQLKELPPKGKWKGFPCCCIAGTTDIIEKEPEAVRAYVKLMQVTADWSQKNKKEASAAAADWLGLAPEVIAKAEMDFSTKVTKKWMGNAALYVDMLNKLEQMTGQLKGKKLSDVEKLVFDFRFIDGKK